MNEWMNEWMTTMITTITMTMMVQWISSSFPFWKRLAPGGLAVCLKMPNSKSWSEFSFYWDMVTFPTNISIQSTNSPKVYFYFNKC